ncbi:MAG: hypothetical protein HY266_07775 [Deltaproteobacteria bacterium]|nr:hypothetical protein [Deltaproteobacteria bacterium]
MTQTELPQEVRQMRFEEIYGKWLKAKGFLPLAFSHPCRYEDDGTEGLKDKRLARASARRAESKSGHFICCKREHLYLLRTEILRPHDYFRGLSR